MQTTKRMKVLEAEHGRPIRTLIIDAYTKTGNLEAAAASLGLSERALFYWMRRLHIRIAKAAIIAPFADEAEREVLAAGLVGGS